MTTIAQAAQALGSGVPTAIKHTLMTRVTLAVHQHIDRNTPVRTGALKRSTQHEVSGTGDFGTIRNANPVAVFVHGGTRAHDILPKRPGGVLRFEVNGVVIFSKRVRHPGTKANPFFDTGLRDAQADIAQILSDTGLALASWLFGGRR